MILNRMNIKRFIKVWLRRNVAECSISKCDQTWSSGDLSLGLETSRDPFLQVLVLVLVLEPQSLGLGLGLETSESWSRSRSWNPPVSVSVLVLVTPRTPNSDP